jgi:pimeloyl-ACP methyl ester carboxylesterase
MLIWHGAKGTTFVEEAPAGKPFLTLQAVDGARRSARPVRLAYREYRGPSGTRSTLIVLLHGSPGSSDDFARLGELLARQRPVIIPDLPGFGDSSRDLPDYSFLAHAAYVHDLLQAKGIARAHVLGFSMGGGVAISLSALDSARVASVVLLSAIGVQETELLGEYHLNHVIHGAQLAGLWLLSRGLPHGGTLDRPHSYARNFYDSDQRPLRDALAMLEAPALIVHGQSDPLVPIETAREHARLLPQSTLRVLEGNHFMLFQDSDRIAPIVDSFLARVDRGLEPTRREADSMRAAAAAAPFDQRIVPRARAVNAAVLGSVVGLASALSGSLGPIGAGVLVAQGRAGFLLAMASSLVGALVIPLRRRTVRTAARSALITCALVSLGIVMGASVLTTPFLAAAGAWTRALAVTGIVGGTAWLLLVCVSPRRRRLAVSSWVRLTRWEYWPPWIAYLPLVGWIAALAVKHRSLVAFTAANPAIVAGGFVGESKFDILRGLRASGDRVARSALIAGHLTTAAKRREAAAFMQSAKTGLPVVLKPNEGQRGSGVVVARTMDALHAYLDCCVVDTIIQEYVPGVEFGVFYYRRPSDARGRILSVTEKRLPSVVGDGYRTLEQLILDDQRAVGMARFHLRQQQARLSERPDVDQVVSLGDLGTHCRGALFLDGAHVMTAALEQAFDEISKGFDGFYFGRYDVRASSIDAFKQGRGFKVIELNGVTSEATHIYDPGIGLIEAYRVLFEQWRLAFEIGAENVTRGAEVASLRTLGRLLLQYRQTARGHLEPRG